MKETAMLGKYVTCKSVFQVLVSFGVSFTYSVVDFYCQLQQVRGDCGR